MGVGVVELVVMVGVVWVVVMVGVVRVVGVINTPPHWGPWLPLNTRLPSGMDGLR